MVESFPYHFPQIQPTAEAIQFAMAANVLRTFLGNEWCDVNLISEGSPYLTPTAQDTTSRMKGQARIVALAEMIFNLQHASGAQARFEALTRVDFESAIAELEAARLLVINNVPFRFVLETGRKQQDYDIELTAQNGEVVCCETKCKMESTGFSGRSLLDSLNQAVKQLPSASPGIVFIKFPETWVQNSTLKSVLGEIITNFFRNTKRIVEVVVHWEEWHQMQTGALLRLVKCREIENQRSCYFDPRLVNFLKGPNPLWVRQQWKHFSDAFEVNPH